MVGRYVYCQMSVTYCVTDSLRILSREIILSRDISNLGVTYTRFFSGVMLALSLMFGQKKQETFIVVKKNDHLLGGYFSDIFRKTLV